MESPSLSLVAMAIASTEERERSWPPPPKKEKVEEELEEDLFRTPTSVKSKLPSVPTSPCPPPAPKKGRRMVGCKRRLTSEFEIIGVTAEELQRVFGPRDPPVPAADRGHAKKCKLNYQ